MDLKRFFHESLKVLGSSLIHNHPSGNIQPSEADRAITDKLMNAGKFLDIAESKKVKTYNPVLLIAAYDIDNFIPGFYVYHDDKLHKFKPGN